MSRLLDELKRKFKTPADALRALGIDEELIRSTLAMDEKMPENAEECLSQLREMILSLPSDEQVRLLDELRDLVDSGDPAQWAETTTDAGPDEPPYFPGRPERGGGLGRGEDRRRIAADRSLHRRALAYDRAHDTTNADRAERDFRRRFPNIPRVERA